MPTPIVSRVPRRWLTTAALAALLLPLPDALRAQAASGTLVGYVMDSTAAAVPAAEVIIDGSASRARTGDRGEFRLTGAPTGPIRVTVRRLGYRLWTERFDVAPGDSLQLMISLVPVPAPLPEVRVTGRSDRLSPLADFNRRRASGFGQFLTRAEIVKRGAVRASDLFRAMAGVVVVPSQLGPAEVKIARAHGCSPATYLDGREAPEYRVDDIPTTDIEAIEVFRGPSEIPPQFRHIAIRETGLAPNENSLPADMAGRAIRDALEVRGPECGVVSIWTRTPGTQEK